MTRTNAQQAVHRRAEPHCTCNDCMADFIGQQAPSMTRYTTLRDLAADLSEVLDLDAAQVAGAISQHRALFSRYEAITADEYDALCRAVWDAVTGGADYPYAEAGQ